MVPDDGLMRSLKPLRGKALIEMLPAAAFSGSIFLPQVARQEPTTEFGRAKLVNPRGNCIEGIVRGIGPWPQIKKGKFKGFQVIPEFKIGDRVVINPGTGLQMKRHGILYRIVEQMAVLALLK